MKLYKLTREDFTTHGRTLWGEGVTHTASNGEPTLCSSTVIHAYKCPRLAILMNPSDANFNPAILWECEGEIVISDGTKVGCKSLTTIRQIQAPSSDSEIIVRFAILCAAKVCKNKNWTEWANAWLKNTDRSQSAASAARSAARAARAAHVADYVAADAADYAADAAHYAACAAHYAACAAYAARAAAYAAYAARSADAAHYAARSADAEKIDFAALAKQAFDKNFTSIQMS